MLDERASERESRHYKTTLVCAARNRPRTLVSAHNVLYLTCVRAKTLA